VILNEPRDVGIVFQHKDRLTQISKPQPWIRDVNTRLA
jgi:hypothetical protein